MLNAPPSSDWAQMGTMRRVYEDFSSLNENTPLFKTLQKLAPFISRRPDVRFKRFPLLLRGGNNPSQN